jgi:hypothetical protein
MNYVAAVRMSPGGTKHEHIVEVIWVTDKFNSGKSSTAQIITHLRKSPGSIKVTDGTTTATVEVVEAQPPYIRSIKDGAVSDNLLKVTRY